MNPCVDEILAMDLGSQDSTLQVCANYGVKVLRSGRRDNFSTDRNELISAASSEWVVSLRADEVLPQVSHGKLQALLGQQISSPSMGVEFEIIPRDSAEQIPKREIRMFRNRPEIRYQYRVHEQVLPSIQELGGSVVSSDIQVVRIGGRESEARYYRDREYEFFLLHLDLADRPHDFGVLSYLGEYYFDEQHFDLAARYLVRCVRERITTNQERLVRAYLLLVRSLLMLGRRCEAKQFFHQAQRLCPQQLGSLQFHPWSQDAYLQEACPKKAGGGILAQRRFSSPSLGSMDTVGEAASQERADANTEQVLLGETKGKLSRSEKIVYLMRGLPSSGKSYTARKIAGATGVVCETDSFFHHHAIKKAGRTLFPVFLLPMARRWNRERFIAAIETGTSPVVVDRGNGLNSETYFYARYALSCGYQVQLQMPETWWWAEVCELLKSKEAAKRELDTWAERLAEMNHATHRTTAKSIRRSMGVWISGLTVDEILNYENSQFLE